MSKIASMPLKYGAEREVEAVEVLLVLDEAGARQRVEVVDRKRDDALVERLEKRQELARGHRQLVRLEMQEEAGQHGCIIYA